MSKKRFKIDIHTLPTTIVDSETSELYSSMRSVVDLLNSLSDDVKHLEEYSGDLESDLKRLEGVEEDLFKFLKENTLLLCKIHKVKEIVREADCFSDEAIEHDIIAYREMQHFDNKDAYDIAFAFKKIKEVLQNE